MTGETFETIEEMYAADPRRKFSRELDFGVWWKERDIDWPRHRVSWIFDTGEVYAYSQRKSSGPPTVVILGVISEEERVEAVLEGWADHCGPPNGLQWVCARLAAAGATA
jgi:hypothetical protein